jgi:hypothetical protein
MGLFRRRKRHSADQPAEEAAEMREVSGSSVFGPGALSSVRPSGSGFFGFVRPIDKTIATEEMRIGANQEDDGARTQMIENERRRNEEYGT